MAEAAEGASSQDIEFGELLGFLQDTKPEVREMAAEGVLSYTENTEFLEYCRLNPRKAARPLLRLMEKAEADATEHATAAQLAEASNGGATGKKAAQLAEREAAKAIAIGKPALQALVNLSIVPTVRDELVELKAPRRCAEALRAGWLEGRAHYAHWYGMILANITTSQAGQEAIVEDEPLLRFLFAAYVAKPRPPAKDGYDDLLFWLGKVLGNVFALPAGRKCIAGGEGGPSTVAKLLAEVTDRTRRHDVLGALRNLCIDKDCHETLVQTDFLTRVAHFVYPLGQVPDDYQAKLPTQLREDLVANGATLTGDGPIRHATVLCIVGMCRTVVGRKYLRVQGCEEVLRAWILEEGDEDTRQGLETSLGALRESELDEKPEEVTQEETPDASSNLDDVDGA